MTARRTDALTPGDVVQTAEIPTYREVVDVLDLGNRHVLVTLGPAKVYAERTIQISVHQSRLWVIRDK